MREDALLPTAPNLFSLYFAMQARASALPGIFALSLVSAQASTGFLVNLIREFLSYGVNASCNTLVGTTLRTFWYGRTRLFAGSRYFPSLWVCILLQASYFV